MSPLFFGLFGGLAAVGVELLFKRYPDVPWWPYLWAVTLPLQAIINWSIWNILQRDSLLGVAIWFSAFTAMFRLIATMWMRTPIGDLTWAAYALTIGALIMKVGDVYGRSTR